jgi:CheY-like chemotaxis protein
MNATKNPFRVIEPHEVFDTVASVRAMNRQQSARFDSRQPIPLLRAERHHAARALPASQGLIFVVDAYPGLAEFAKTILDHAGFPACAFNDGVIAWHAFAFAAAQPQLLVVDDSTVNLSGRELIRLCRAINPDLKVILVKDRSSDSASLSPNVADAVLDKPYCGPLLVQEVRRLCGPLSRDASSL